MWHIYHSTFKPSPPHPTFLHSTFSTLTHSLSLQEGVWAPWWFWMPFLALLMALISFLNCSNQNNRKNCRYRYFLDPFLFPLPKYLPKFKDSGMGWIQTLHQTLMGKPFFFVNHGLWLYIFNKLNQLWFAEYHDLLANLFKFLFDFMYKNSHFLWVLERRKRRPPNMSQLIKGTSFINLAFKKRYSELKVNLEK